MEYIAKSEKICYNIRDVIIYETKLREEKVNIRFDFSNVLREAVGSEGISLGQFGEKEREIDAAFSEVKEMRGKGWYGWCDLPYKSEEEIEAVLAHAKSVREKAESFVLFGIGGSALGPLSVAFSLLHMRHNELPRQKRKAPKFYVEDNVDPERMASLMDVISLENTHFNFITKSGETSETLSQFLIIYKMLKEELGEEAARNNVTITTTIGKGSLYEIAMQEGLKVFGVEEGVGGRFSVLSNVGLFPLAVMGINIKLMLEGARQMTEWCLVGDSQNNPALFAAFLHTEGMRRGKNISVMMPYADSLKYMSDFFAQLWGESLGKEMDNEGKAVRCGQTPVKALGVTDQHSQIQLYVAGPHDKIVTFIEVDEYRSEVLIPHDDDIKKGEFLMGNTLNKLISSECTATAFALTKSGCPNYTIILPNVNARIIGQLLTFFMYQTAFAGSLLRIDAFNQPGVEEGKKATFAILGRKGYEEKMKEITSKTSTRFVIKRESEN